MARPKRAVKVEERSEASAELAVDGQQVGLAVTGPKAARRAASAPQIDPNRPVGSIGMLSAHGRCGNHHCFAPLLPAGYFAFVLASDHAPYRAGLSLCLDCASSLHDDARLRVDAFLAKLDGRYDKRVVARLSRGLPDPRSR